MKESTATASRKKGRIALAQRQAVVDATFSVIVRDGLAQTSMRAIADELGCSTGVLTHHFRDKNAILSVAMDRVGQSVSQRMNAAAKGKQTSDALFAQALAYLPSDKQSKQLWSVWVQFLVFALSDESVLEKHRGQYDWLRQRLLDYLGELNDQGLLQEDVDLELEADYLVALLEGLGVQGLISPKRYNKAMLSRIISHHMQRLMID